MAIKTSMRARAFMPMTLVEIEKEAPALNNEDKLILTLDVSKTITKSQNNDLWNEEAVKRRDELFFGKVKSIPLKDIMTEVEEKRD